MLCLASLSSGLQSFPTPIPSPYSYPERYPCNQVVPISSSTSSVFTAHRARAPYTSSHLPTSPYISPYPPVPHYISPTSHTSPTRLPCISLYLPGDDRAAWRECARELDRRLRAHQGRHLALRERHGNQQRERVRELKPVQ